MYGVQRACTLVGVRASQRRVWFVGVAQWAFYPRTEWFTSHRQNPLNWTHRNIHSDTCQNNNTHMDVLNSQFPFIRHLNFMKATHHKRVQKILPFPSVCVHTVNGNLQEPIRSKYGAEAGGHTHGIFYDQCGSAGGQLDPCRCRWRRSLLITVMNDVLGLMKLKMVSFFYRPKEGSAEYGQSATCHLSCKVKK